MLDPLMVNPKFLNLRSRQSKQTHLVLFERIPHPMPALAETVWTGTQIRSNSCCSSCAEPGFPLANYTPRVETQPAQVKVRRDLGCHVMAYPWRGIEGHIREFNIPALLLH
jgi:hypothetical protein